MALTPTPETRAQKLPRLPPSNPHLSLINPFPYYLLEGEHLQLTPTPPKTDTHIRKRPLLHPPIPSPYTSSAQPKIIYISAHTPFISAVKRVRKLLGLIEKRATEAGLQFRKGADHEQRLRALEKGVLLEGGGVVGVKGKGREKGEVVLKATNRAVEKALGLAVFFQGQGDLRVRMKTGTVGVVDDLEVRGEVAQVKGKKGMRKGKGGDVEREGGRQDGGEGEVVGEEVRGKDGGGDVDMEDPEEAGEEEVPETRIRKVSVLEVAITLK